MTNEAFAIGTRVTGTDGVCGKLERVVIDPLKNEVTHLMVEPAHGAGFGRLLPLSLVADSGDPITVTCSRDEFMALPHAEETYFLPRAMDILGNPLSPRLGGLGANRYDAMIGTEPVLRETLPPGEVSVRRGESVHATDGEVGRVQGLVIDRDSGHVSHVLLQEGHLWGKHDVVIPIGVVTSMEHGVAVSLTKAEIEALPAVDVEHPSFGAEG